MDNIFDPDGELAIDCADLEVDMTQLTIDRLLYQFRNSGTLVALNTVLADMEQQAYDAALGVIKGRTLANAEGVSLDVIGVIVGQRRILLNAETKAWFTPDNAFRPDVTPAFVTGAPLFGDLPASDADYRRLILSKIFKNHVKAGSVPEIIRFVELLTGQSISVLREAPMDLALAVPSTMTPNDLYTIISVLDDKTADRKYLMPLPVTARLVNIIFRPPIGFKPDCVDGRPDFASLSVRFAVSDLRSFN